MSFLAKLEARYQNTGASLCVGIDPNPAMLPKRFPHTARGIFQFLKIIIEVTQPHAAAYKPNLAFFESLGAEGQVLLEKVLGLIPDTIPYIIDAKRGDIGSSSEQYAKAIFEQLGADAVTVSPYMGYDSVAPFLEFEGKGVFILGLTSNPGRSDVQLLKLENGQHVFESLMQSFQAKPSKAARGWVIGATLGDLSQKAVAASGTDAILVPGVGAQGGDLKTIFAHAHAKNPAHVIINASRSILYASTGSDFAERAAAEALGLAEQIKLVNRQDAKDASI